MRRLALAIGLAMFSLPSPSDAACGDRSGPGYRGPNGKCVGWAELGRVCGSPPETRCTPENVQENARAAAGKGKAIEDMRPPVPAKERK
ncbi:MAG TPA: hypothetical protein VNQ99_17780 [Xanthobacteraceae bacterium]|nr:hypothetical protein [Xanthobacteraceae bacterium]